MNGVEFFALYPHAGLILGCNQRRLSLKPSAARLLARLVEGPATTHDLISLGMIRYSARLKELRDRGYKIKTKILREGSALYTLEAE